MISLPCTSCKKVLEIDDAFAGGVCRCQHCGTIQTVPAQNKSKARIGAPLVQKALYEKNKSRKDAADEAAGTPPAKVRAAQPTAASKSIPWKPIVAISAGALFLIALCIWLLT